MIELANRHDGGLAQDFPLVRRRRMTGLAGGTTVAALAGVAQDRSAPAAAPAMSSSGLVRDDIRRGFGTSHGLARGVPLTVRLRLVSANSGQPLPGYAVYLWQSDRDGNYSLYSPGLTGENYLRGVQASNDAGWVQFRSIFPGAPAGRWPHLRLEVYPSLDAVTQVSGRLRACRLSLPADACASVYARPDYAASRAGLSADPAGDDGAFEMASVTGCIERGFTAVRTVVI